jgi:hypothetical protein
MSHTYGWLVKFIKGRRIADLAGDCFGSPADVFELVVAAEIIDAMILGSSLASEIRIPMRPYDTCSSTRQACNWYRVCWIYT